MSKASRPNRPLMNRLKLITSRLIKHNRFRRSESDSDSDQLTNNLELFIAIRKKGKTEDQKLIEIEEIFKKNPKPNVNFQDRNNHENTPLHIAIKKGYEKIADFLFKNGARTDIKNEQDKIPLELAETSKKAAFIEILKSPAIQSNLQDSTVDQQSLPVVPHQSAESMEIDETESQSAHQNRVPPQAGAQGRGQKRAGSSTGSAPSSRRRLSFSGEPNEYPASGLKHTLHGNSYQLKLLMLFLHRGVKKGYDFRLATEMDAAEKFDDLVFKYKNEGQDNFEFRFLQAKHKQDESKKISYSDLLNEKEGEFSLEKYFISYQKIKKNPELNGILKDFILCTNIDLDSHGLQRENIELEAITAADDFLEVASEGKTSARYRLKVAQSHLLYEKLKETSEAHRLAKTLVEHVTKGAVIELRSDIFKKYHRALTEEIINTTTKKFQDKFIKDDPALSQSAKNFRALFIKAALKEKKLASVGTNEAALCTKLEALTLRISSSFGAGTDKVSLPTDAVTNIEIDGFFAKLLFAVDQPNEEQLGVLIQQEIGAENQFNLIDSDLIADHIQRKMWDWFKEKEGRFLSTADGKHFFEVAQQKMDSLVLAGPTLDYQEKIKELGIVFKAEVLTTVNNFLSSNDKKILFLKSPEKTLLNAIKVYQTLAGNAEYKQNDSYIFIRLNKLLRLQNRAINAFKSTDNYHLMVIECQPVTQNIEILENELYRTIELNPGKKIILISQENNSLIDQFKTRPSNQIENMDGPTNFDDLTPDAQQKLLATPVNFQGEMIPLNELTDGSQPGVIDSGSLEKLLETEPLVIGEVLPVFDGENEQYYIDRTFNRQIVINKRIQQGSTSTDLLTLSDTDLVTISDTQDRFNALCQENPNKNVHWLKAVAGKLFWQQSQGTLSALRPYVEVTDTQPYSEIQMLPDENYQKIVLIADSAGIGKSTVLTSLSKQIKEATPALWVVRVDLNDYTEQLKEQSTKPPFNEKTRDSAVDFVSEKLLKLSTPIEKLLFENSFQIPGKITLLLDGFDEISPDYKETVLGLLQVLKQTSVKQIYVTTRPQTREILEDQLQQFSYTLEPFSEAQQIKFLQDFFEKSLKLRDNLIVHDSEKIALYSKKLIQKLSESIGDQEQKFTGTPLQVRMLAEIYQDEMQAFYQSDQVIPEIPEKLGLTELYEKFIEKKYEIYQQEKLKAPIGNQAANDESEIIESALEESYRQWSFKTLFSEEQLRGLPFSEAQNNAARNRVLTRIGIAQITDDKAHFIHRTFAEYFAADWLAARLVEEDPTPEVWSKFLLEEILLRSDYPVIRAFLNGQLTKNLPSENSLEEYGQRISKMPQVIGPYGPEETFLHIAFREGHLAIGNFLLSSLKEHPETLKYLLLATEGNYKTALHSAVLSDQGGAVTGLLEFVKDHLENKEGYEGTLQSLVLATDLDGKMALNTAAFNGKTQAMAELLTFAKANFASEVLKEIVLATERDGSNVLHNAIFSGNAETMEELLKFAKDELVNEDFKSWVLAVEEDTRNTIENYNILHRAVLTGKVEIVRKLWSFVENNLDPEGLKNLLEGTTRDGKTAQQLIEEIEFSEEIKEELRQPFLINDVVSLHKEFDHLALVSSGTASSCSPMSQRRKRDLGICQREEAEEGSRPLFPYDPLDDTVSPEQQRASRLSTQSAMAVAWQQPEQFPEATIENSLHYNTYSGDIIQEGSRNHSPREKALLDQHYQEAQQFIREIPKETLWKNDDAAEPAGEVRRSWLFDNGRYSLLALYDGQRYQLYSQDFNYHQIFQTRASVTFSEITAFAQAFFKWRSGSGDHSTLTLQDAVSRNVIEKLQAASFWEPDRIKSDSLLLAGEQLPPLSGIPVKAVRSLIRLNGEVPDYAGLYPNVFNDPAAQITLRVDQLHKVLPTLTEVQRQTLVAAVKKHSWLEDKSASNGLSPEDKPLFDTYCQHVIETLTAAETTTITPEQLSELSWNTLSQHFDQHPDSETAEQLKALKEQAMASAKEIHAKASKSAWAKEMAKQTLFFLPDIIRSANSGNVDNLAKTGAVVGGDAAINKGYSALVDGLETVLPEGRAALLRKLPVASPIFKVLTVYSIVELTQQLNTLPADSPQRGVIQHKLGEQYVTAGLMVVELLGFEVAPLWIGLIAEQLIFDTITFRKENQLDIPFWEAFIMSLGFEQDKLQGILEERQLVDISLSRVNPLPDTITNASLAKADQLSVTPSDSDGWVLIHVPTLEEIEWRPLSRDQIPDNIIKKIEAESLPWIFMSNQEREADGFKEVIHHAEPPILSDFEMVFFYRPPNLSITIHWEQRIYHAVPSSIIVQFSPGARNYQEDNTFLPDNRNYKKIASVMNTEEESGYSMAETPVIIENGLAALYVNNKTFSDSNAQRSIYVGFDSREGHMTLNFTAEGLRKIDEINRSHNPSYVVDDKSHYMVTVEVRHKYYPNSVIFPLGYYGFYLIDSSKRIISQYVISDNHSFQIRDGAAATRIALATQALDGDKENATIYAISGDSNTIKIQNIRYHSTDSNGNMTINKFSVVNENRIILEGPKKHLQLMIKDAIIRNRLVVSAETVDILYAKGVVNSSSIEVSQTVLTFNVGLIGNIIVNSGETRLQLTGEIPKASDPIGYAKMISDNITSIYTLKIANLEPVIHALPREKLPSLEIFMPSLKLSWNNNSTASKALLKIEGKLEGQKAFLEIHPAIDTLKIFDSNNTLTTVKNNHYTPEAVVDKQLVLTDILKPYQARFVSNRTAQDVYSDFLKTGSLVTSNITAYPMDGHILVFLAPEGHQVFHRFTAPGGINLNGIRYTVQGKEIYAVPGDNGVIEGNQLLHYRRHPNATQLSVVGIQFSGSVGESKISLKNETLAIGNVTLKNLPDDTLFYFGNHSFSMRSLKETLAPRATVGNRTLPSVLRWRRAAPVEVASAHSSGTRLNFWPLKAVTEGLSYLVDWSSHWITLPIAHQAVAPKVPLNNPPDLNTLHCMPGAWVDGGYSGDGITCAGRSGTARVFINNDPQAMSVSGAGPRQIASDNFTKGRCWPIEFNGRTSVYCKGKQTTLVYTPELPSRPFEQLDGQLMLGRVLLGFANKLWSWVQSGMISSPKVAPVLIIAGYSKYGL